MCYRAFGHLKYGFERLRWESREYRDALLSAAASFLRLRTV